VEPYWSSGVRKAPRCCRLELRWLLVFISLWREHKRKLGCGVVCVVLLLFLMKSYTRSAAYLKKEENVSSV
jgi:hypothetical protein